MGDWIAYVNSAVQHARVWSQSLVVAKLDVRRMLASVSYFALHDTLVYFNIPVEWIRVIFNQVTCVRFELHALNSKVVYGDLYNGLVEGSPLSMLLIGLTLTRCLRQLEETPGYKDLQVAL